jgi:phospholipid/cholesterol/gamma-HCH transport system substrate-binding protein
VKHAIKTHSADFAAIIALLVLAIVVSAYVLTNERFRFPLVESAPFSDYVELQTAQAVTPGQGQSVRVSGVQIGDIGAVTLKNGYAIVRMDIDPKYKQLIHTNATALLRPRTGLDDMFLELDPGGAPAPVAKPGYTIPLSSSNPDVNLDEMLSSLDGDTRAYLDMLVNGAGEGLKNNGGDQLAQVFQRFEPTHRDLARLNSAVARRGADLQQLVNSLARLNTALAVKQSQIVRLVDTSSVVFRAFASQDANVSRAVADLPATLRHTTATLEKVQSFATELGPAATNLLPAARGLPSANQALTALAEPGAPIVKNEIRPFVVASRPVVRDLKPAAVNLSKATPSLETTFNVLNHFVNLLGYNPGSSQHGYLWWLAWADHNARSLFANQDANGDMRALFLEANCNTLAAILNSNPLLALSLNAVTAITNPVLCPTTAAKVTSDYRAYKAGTLPANQAVSKTAAAGVKVPFLPNLLSNSKPAAH